MKMHHSVPIIVLTLLYTPPGIDGGKVLVFPLDGSHWVNMKILIEELHAKGHNLTVLRASNSWYIKKDSPFYNSITIPNTGGFDEEFFSSMISQLLKIKREGNSIWNRIQLEYEVILKFKSMHEDMTQMIEKLLEDKEIMKSIKDAHYDVILADPAVGGGAILAHKFNIPLVFNARWTINGEGHFAIAPSPLSYIPVPGILLTDMMSFLQRVKNVLIYFFTLFQITMIADPPYKSFCNKHIGPDVHYFTLFQEADIWLMRTDFTFEFPRPTMPNIVYMGGFQCKPAKPLPADLEEFVQSSGQHGVIIMTLGTLIAQLPHDVTDEIAAAFAQLPQKVIWRYTGPRPVTLGNNTLLVDWLPQNDLLGHTQIKAFVAHGGTNGVQEAIYHGVPIVGLPLVFDQPDNLFRMEAKGTAKIVDIATLDRTVFLEALKEVLHNPFYKENMQRLSKLHHDQPMKPLDRAVFWIEFVMRNGGAPHLRTQSFRMSWIAYHSIDVILTLIATLFMCVFFTMYVIRYIFRVLFKTKVKRA
ncbi:UDP glucuronosyltransferase 5 family, polypeptide A1 [Xyrauchen texanus]|uniref:UDP glucuronosyltransferase 5 family, polypeptide A1 n=1 Tax=Xyrauchen texanus TaxID=154827 RepID=UPI0022423097|nr:UDP glucuronosyltransferase 5 family, polypeptide A1 [Xyrauchen texanus]